MTGLLDLPPEILERICHLAICYAEEWSAQSDSCCLVKPIHSIDPNRRTLRDLGLTCKSLRDVVPDEIGRPSRFYVMHECPLVDFLNLADEGRGSRLQSLLLQDIHFQMERLTEVIYQLRTLNELSLVVSGQQAAVEPLMVLLNGLAALPVLRHLQLHWIGSDTSTVSQALQGLSHAAATGLRLHTLIVISPHISNPAASFSGHAELHSLSLWTPFYQTEQFATFVESAPPSLRELHVLLAPRCDRKKTFFPPKLRAQLLRLSLLQLHGALALDSLGLDTFAKLEQLDFRSTRVQLLSREHLPPTLRTLRVELNDNQQEAALNSLRGHLALERISIPAGSTSGRSWSLQKDNGQMLEIVVEEVLKR